MVESTAFCALYVLPSLHSTPVHFPFSTISCVMVLLVRITPPWASINRASACVKVPDPPRGVVQLHFCLPAQIAYARRPVAAASGGSTVWYAIHTMNARQCSSSKLSRMIYQADIAKRRCQILPLGCSASRSFSGFPKPIGVYDVAANTGFISSYSVIIRRYAAASFFENLANSSHVRSRSSHWVM